MVSDFARSCRWAKKIILAASLCFPFLALAHAQQTPNHSPPPPGSSDNLSEKLDKSNGVLKPREDGDPGITKPAPNNDQRMPVIPPPGSPGGNPDVQPK